MGEVLRICRRNFRPVSGPLRAEGENFEEMNPDSAGFAD